MNAIFTLLLLLLLQTQQTPGSSAILKPGKPLEGKITDQSPLVETPTTKKTFTDAPVRGETFIFQVPESGPWHLDLRSYFFDAYLVLRDAEDRLLAEDDNGLIGVHSRIVAELESGREYRVVACALHGKRGAFGLLLQAGKPPPLSPKEKAAADLTDARERVRAIEAVQGPDGLGTASALNDLATFLEEDRRYQEARPLFERALAIREKALGPEHLGVAASLDNLAWSYQDQGRYGEAERLYRRALAIRQKALGPGHPDVADNLSHVGSLLLYQGRYGEAKPFFERALAIREKALGPDHPLVALSLSNLAMLLLRQGSYQEAVRLLERAVAVYEKRPGPGKTDLAGALNNLAGLYKTRGRYEEARPLYERALAIWEKALGRGHPNVATTLNNLASLLEAQGRYEEARPLYERALAIREKALGPEHPDLAKSFNNLAGLYKIRGRYEEARPLYEQALAIFEKALGPEHPYVAKALNNLASLLQVQGRYEEAQPLYARALAILENALDSDHPDVARGLDRLAVLLGVRGRHGEARLLHARSLRSRLAYLDRELPTMSEAGRFRLLGLARGPDRLLRSWIASGTAPDRLVLDLSLQWKGKATRLQAAELRLSRQADTPDLRRRKGDIQAVGKELSTLVFLPVGKRAEDHEERVAALRKKRLDLERALNRDLGLEEVLATPASKEVQAALPADAVLLDFYVASEVFAWVLHREGEPELVSLGKAEPLRKAQAAFLHRSGVRGAAALQKEGRDPASVYAGLLWKPLAALVGDAGTVLVSPDGFLGELPFGILPDGEGHFLIERHRFAYLSDATRIVGTDGPAAEREGSVLAVGDVNYYQREETRFGPALVLAASHSRSRIGDTWPSLEATREELRSLRDLHDLVLGWTSPFDQLDGQGATEEAVRAALPGHRYLHLATHGYFEPDDLPSLMRDAEEKEEKAALGEEVKAVGLLPGLLSGLVLAGVNGQPDPDRDDGYLSAEEIQYLDLSACDLAVLSACETALGSERAGEGLQSLRRGFAVAGAKTVISSLWKVDDRAAATLMRHFYENYWQKGMEKLEALHKAKLRMLRQNRADYGGDARPATWGAFVLSGDWR